MMGDQIMKYIYIDNVKNNIFREFTGSGDKQWITIVAGTGAVPLYELSIPAAWYNDPNDSRRVKTGGHLFSKVEIRS
jgi:hypothetical protein